MITEGVYSTIIGVLQAATEDETEPERYRDSYRLALEEFQADRRHAMEAAVAADPDPTLAARRAGGQLVERVIQAHALRVLEVTRKRPEGGDTWPAVDNAAAQWRMIRMQALQALPVDVAAGVIKEQFREFAEQLPNDHIPYASMTYGGHTYRLEVQRLDLSSGAIELLRVRLDGETVTEYARPIQ